MMPLVLLPGMLGNRSLWSEAIDVMSSHKRQRPVTHHVRTDQERSVTNAAHAILAHAPERFALAGHSLGGILALEVVRQAPTRVDRLALISSSAAGPSHAQRSAWAELSRRVRAGQFEAVVAELACSMLPTSRQADRSLLTHSSQMAISVGPEGMLRQLDIQANRPEYFDTLAAIDVPTLIVSGDLDRVAPVARQDELVAGIRDSRHVIMKRCGHLPPLEQPDALARELSVWLYEM